MTVGRKLAFDKDAALEAAMEVFWHKGYVGASLSELTEAMGINKPSLYGTFGNKEALFSQAVEKYAQRVSGSYLGLLHESGLPLKERLQRFMTAMLSAQCDKDSPRGCFISACLSESANDDIPESAIEGLYNAHQQMRDTITQLFQQDEEAHAYGLDKQASEHALFICTMLSGTAAMARTGKDLSVLSPVIGHTLAALGLE
ncbi:TetR/AcrR family transcriptional regulator [Bowmanella dokdonensis]|uniref:TetR/AcrR family transcriptional regulator n=1 Tax=Bowmanella dokdonensis TaxID=751969 RepID=A0A939DMF8_9ALTE|nr:TetR/AcrR family transcriptional regulator [Bowmanella dokdonensis]MBN7825279.1 TetR/AcrR family transcriptional regulator [Bowmanella dokdonensis]